MTYHGKYKVKNPRKYKGNPDNVRYRSSWERQVFRWCESTPEVIKWNSEEVVIPYRCKTDGQMHRYFVDLYLEMANGNTYLIEIKPHAQTQPPTVSKRKTRKYLNEVMTYAKNISKWEKAHEVCESRGWIFQVWTEETIKNLGIKLI